MVFDVAALVGATHATGQNKTREVKSTKQHTFEESRFLIGMYLYAIKQQPNPESIAQFVIRTTVCTMFERARWEMKKKQFNVLNTS